MCMCVCLCELVCPTCVQAGVFEGQKVTNHLELKLQLVVSVDMGAGNQASVVCNTVTTLNHQAIFLVIAAGPPAPPP